jgi:hypothetical protein
LLAGIGLTIGIAMVAPQAAASASSSLGLAPRTTVDVSTCSEAALESAIVTADGGPIDYTAVCNSSGVGRASSFTVQVTDSSHPSHSATIVFALTVKAK